MVGHGGSSVGSYLADPTSPIPSHCASIVVTSTLRVKKSLIKNVHVTNCNHQDACQPVHQSFGELVQPYSLASRSKSWVSNYHLAVLLGKTRFFAIGVSSKTRQHTILIRALAEVCALHNALKIKLEGDILMVIIHSKFYRRPFRTFLKS